MPFYDYHCEKCEVTWSALNKIAERDEPLHQPCPSCDECNCITRPMEVPGIVSGVAGITHHLPNDFRQLVGRIKKANRGSTLPDL